MRAMKRVSGMMRMKHRKNREIYIYMMMMTTMMMNDDEVGGKEDDADN